jgi:hypothetical protein
LPRYSIATLLLITTCAAVYCATPALFPLTMGAVATVAIFLLFNWFGVGNAYLKLMILWFGALVLLAFANS